MLSERENDRGRDVDETDAVLLNQLAEGLDVKLGHGDALGAGVQGHIDDDGEAL